jgi:hypothetical protein
MQTKHRRSGFDPCPNPDIEEFVGDFIVFHRK